jgi:hypothetical protein
MWKSQKSNNAEKLRLEMEQADAEAAAKRKAEEAMTVRLERIMPPAEIAHLDIDAAQDLEKKMEVSFHRGVDRFEDDDDDYVFPDPIPVHQKFPTVEEPAYIDPRQTTG